MFTGQDTGGNMKKFGKIFLAVLAVIGICGGIFFSVKGLTAKAESIEVSSFEQLKEEVGSDASRNIILVNDIVFSETLVVGKDLSITANGNVTITRGEDFSDTLLEIENGAQVSVSATTGNSVVFDGEETQVGSTAIVNKGNLTIGNNVLIKRFVSTVSGVAIKNNGVLILDGAELFENSHVQEDGAATTYGIIMCNDKSSTTFASGKIHDNVTDTSGVFFLNNGAHAQMNGGEVYGNQALDGAGFFVKTATLNINGGKIYSNVATGNSDAYGGAIFAKDEGVTTLGNVEIYENVAVSGSAIYMTDSAKTIINNANIHENVADSYGGGVYAVSNATLEMNGGIIQNHTVASSGAGVFMTGNTTFVLNDGQIKNNAPTSNGGGVIIKSNFEMNGGEISGNTAKIGGGLYVYNNDGQEPAHATINGGTFENNSGTTRGGAITASNAVLTINGGTFKSNSSPNGGAVAVYDFSETVITGGKFVLNTASTRGPDVYAFASAAANYPTLTVTGGEFQEIDTQYAMLNIGGDLKVSDYIRFFSKTTENYAKVAILKELENDIVFKLNNVYDEGTNQRFNYVSTDVYSDIYRTANRIALDYTTPQFVRVENGKMFVTPIGSNKEIDVVADEYVIDAPKYASAGNTVSFGAQKEFLISNVTVTGADSTSIAVTENDGIYSFEMPDQKVEIDYDFDYAPLELTVDSGIADLVDVQTSYNFKQNVEITEVLSNEKKLTKLYLVIGEERKELAINEGSASFNMFHGAKLEGEIKTYHNISYVSNTMVESVNLSSTKGLEGEVITFTISENKDGENVRYALSSVHYVLDETLVEIDEEGDGLFSFIMPDADVEIVFEYKDSLENLDGNIVMVENLSQLQEALNTDETIAVVLNNIEINQTLQVAKGNHTIVSLNNSVLSRADNFNGNMISLGFESVLNLNCDSDALTFLTIDGRNIETSASAIFVEQNGTVNIFNKVRIINNKVVGANSNYTEDGKGNTSAGGAGIYNYNGVVNMHGGEISNNSSEKSGGAVYNYGIFNFYAGTIKNNRAGASGGGVYNIRVFNQDGGVIDGNVSGEYGGGVYNASSFYAFYYLRNGNVTNNTSKYGGGAFNSSDGVVWVKGGLMSNNTATKNGGALYNKGTTFVVDGILSNNKAKDSGGAIASKDGLVVVSGGTLQNNEALTRGGAIYVYGDKDVCAATIRITGGVIEENACPVGDAVCVQYGVLELGSQSNIGGTVELVAKNTATYGYIKVLEDLQNEVTLKTKYTGNIVRLSADVDAAGVVEKINMSADFLIDIINGQIVVSKVGA